MVKPQFEAGRELARVHRGVIQDPEVRSTIIATVTAEIEGHGFNVKGSCDSALPGPKGNVEHFVLAERAVASGAEHAPGEAGATSAREQ
jgi:23S rRNA (cytidine1920-2'-O)/16S rRNA (cytidine1409-2'-O)-methyltransferase